MSVKKRKGKKTVISKLPSSQVYTYIRRGVRWGIFSNEMIKYQ